MPNAISFADNDVIQIAWRYPKQKRLFPEICGRIEGVCFAPGLT
jgi:hypothetical protein